MMKTKIIALVGPSGAGKTYATKYLKREMNIPTIISHTTRPAREDEKDGEDYFFTDGTDTYHELDILTRSNLGDYEYFALKANVPNAEVCTYVVDETGAQDLRKRYGKQYTIWVIGIRCRPEILRERGISEERIQRDAERNVQPDVFFDGIIDNEGTIEAYHQELQKILKAI